MYASTFEMKVSWEYDAINIIHALYSVKSEKDQDDIDYNVTNEHQLSPLFTNW